MTDRGHTPVMVTEVVAGLQPRPGGRYVDGTLGTGADAEVILGACGPSGLLFGCDRDGGAVERVRRRLAERFAGRFEVRQGRFSGLGSWVAAGSCDGVLLDLGCSSVQLDEPGRGLSFQADGPLDMRMDAGQELTAEAVLAEASESELGRWFWEWGGEREARRLARVICRERQVRRLRTTRELAQLIERVVPRRGQRLHPATRVFMALRMWVNGEVEEIERGLPVVWSLLRTGGRMVVISFHSVEDRLVKRFGRERSLPYETMGEVDVPELRRPRVPELREVVRRPLEPGADEVAANPRARSARMRIFERCAAESSR